MPSARAKRARAKQWYASNKEDACAAHRKYYAANAEKCKEASKLAYESKKDSYKKAYANDSEKFKEASKKAYANDPEKFKEASKKAYANDPEKFKEASKKAYANDPEKFKEASKKASKKAYANDPEKFKEASKKAYAKDPGKFKEATKKAYANDPDGFKKASKDSYNANPKRKREASKKAYRQNTEKCKEAFKDNYNEHREEVCSKKREEYALRPPNESLVKSYVESLLNEFMRNPEVKLCLTLKLCKQFPSYTEKLSNKVKAMTACRMAARHLVHEMLSLRKTNAGKFLKHVREVNSLAIDSKTDFGDPSHSVHSEPFYYETAYLHGFQPTKLAVDKAKKCLFVEHVTPTPDQFVSSEPIPLDEQGKAHISEGFACSYVCRTMSDDEVKIILDLKHAFEKPIAEVRKQLQDVDNGCPHVHHLKPSGMDEGLAITEITKAGHPLPCASGMCNSKLRILRAASVHYPALRRLLHGVYMARKHHNTVAEIDNALCTNDYKALFNLMSIEECEDLIGENLKSENNDAPSEFSAEGLVNVERVIQVKYANVFETYKKRLDEDFEYPCSSCERLHKESYITKYTANTEKFDSAKWEQLKLYLSKRDDDFDSKIYYICKHCRPFLNDNKLPATCVLNGLYVEEIPKELSELNALGRQLVQRAKPFQTIIRLGTYTGKVPIYNATKGLKGTMFFLPLPLQNTIETIDDLGVVTDSMSEDLKMLPDPELYILLDGRPTKDKIVWQSLVDVNDIKRAVTKLKETNWLYKNIDENSVDDAAKKAIEVVSSTSSTLIRKATKADIAELEAYTIRRMDESLPLGSDIEHYKMLKVEEPALDNRLKHLDVMCFPCLFPTGRFGEFHPREVKLTFCEYIKSRLLNKDSRFRKNPEFVFYYLWQKELRELSSGIYNVLKTTGKHGMSVKDFLKGVDSSNKQMEANLSTMFQSVRGTKQYWFLKKSDLNCMIREHGPPSLFLTFSCAEYDSPDIASYLHKVNDVPDSYPIGRLCAEDPLSVSRKFSKKFHDFFEVAIIKGEVLGKVDEFFWKKEYQMRGAPHYHVLLWINEAPVIGVDSETTVLKWIQERITCRLPDKASNPELHRLVTKYQMHKCSSYCKRTVKVGGTFLTRCKFGFPRVETDEGKIHKVEDCLKSRSKIYDLPRSFSEMRVNDYNPVLLLLWKANLDIQFISENSLALAQYVTGYVTKAEKSHMHEIWDDVSSKETLYSKLWSFGVRSLRSRECGLYEASDILLSDHLCEKSQTVQWITADQPHKRKKHLRNHNTLKELLENDPDSVSIFNSNLIDDFYPARPAELENVCLYDFVKCYTYCGVDSSGNRAYRKLEKPRLPNHRLYDPTKENERESYYYSLLLLFVPFRHEADLIGEHSSAEQAFNEFLALNDDMKCHHEKLLKMLEAHNRVTEINKDRQTFEVKTDDKTEPEGLQISGEAKAAMNDVHDMDARTSNDFDLHERIEMLNADQFCVFKMVSDHLCHQQKHEKGECLCKTFKPLHTFISGVGGTGKSFLIETIRRQVSEIWKNDTNVDTKCAVGAPTGLASYNIGGVTVHRMFMLPIEHEGRAAGYWRLSKETQKVMRTNLSSLKLVIIDEVSMLSNLNLAYIHLRLEELFGGTDWFGSINIIFVGDLLQLPPVNGDPVFCKLNYKAMSKLGCMGSGNIWKDTVTYDELTINERQKSDPVYSKVLDEIRRGCPSEQSINCLRDRVITVSVVDKYKQLCESGNHPVCLFPTCKQCEEHNNNMLNALDTKLECFPCVDEIDETSSSRKWSKKAANALSKANKDCNLTAGLEAKLTIAVGARVMLRRNIDTKNGLVNGSIGSVTAITSNSITVKFDHIPEPYRVERVKSKFMLMKTFYVYRKQFPLILAYAVTIHKCQGLSLDSAIIDLSSKVFSPGMAYVALSRVRSLNGLYLTEFDPVSIIVSTSCLEENKPTP